MTPVTVPGMGGLVVRVSEEASEVEGTVILGVMDILVVEG